MKKLASILLTQILLSSFSTPVFADKINQKDLDKANGQYSDPITGKVYDHKIKHSVLQNNQNSDPASTDIQYAANPQLQKAQQDFTILQNQIDQNQNDINAARTKLQDLQKELQYSQNRKQDLDKEYIKLIRKYQDQNTNPFLNWIFKIFPFLKPANYDKNARKQILKDNRELSHKMNHTKEVITSQQNAIKQNQAEQENKSKQLTIQAKKLNKQIDNLKDEVNTNNDELDQDKLKKINDAGNAAIKNAENPQMKQNLQKIQQQIQNDPAQAKTEAKGNNSAKDIQPSTDIGYIFAHDVRVPSRLSPEQLAKGLKGNLKPLAPAFVKAENETGINSIFLASLVATESGWNASDTFGKNNIVGYRNKSFKSKEDCIEFIARTLKQDYLNSKGKYFNGYSVSGISKMYCLGNQDWINSITKIGEMIGTATR